MGKGRTGCGSLGPREPGSGGSLWPRLGCRIIQRSLFIVILCKEGWAACPPGRAATAARSTVSLALCQHGGFPALAGTGELLLPI